jgi:RNA polymerase sigma-70 factor (ECF subfamily)
VTKSATTTAPGAPATSVRRQQLEALFTEHGRAVFAFARRRATAADADDVVSETFLVAWRRLDDVPSEPLPWLLGVARKCLANVNRREGRQAALYQRLAETTRLSSAGLESPIDRDSSPAVLDALSHLTVGERDVLTLLAWEGLTPDEAAVALGCSRATVYVRLHRARRRFSAALFQTTENQETR